MKFPVLLTLVSLSATTLCAQKFDLKINAAANLSHVAAFPTQTFIANGFVLPGWYHPNASMSPLITINGAATTKSGVGFNAEVETGLKLNKTWKLSLAIGVSQLRYDYDVHIGYHYDPGTGQSLYKDDFNLSEADSDYGKSSLTYLTARPLNVTASFHKFSIQGGAVLNYLLSAKKTNNAIIIFDPASKEALGGFFEQKGDTRKLLYGAHLNLRYEVIKSLEVMAGGQYFFNSIYKDEETVTTLGVKSNCWQAQLGLSYNLAPLFKR